MISHGLAPYQGRGRTPTTRRPSSPAAGQASIRRSSGATYSDMRISASERARVTTSALMPTPEAALLGRPVIVMRRRQRLVIARRFDRQAADDGHLRNSRRGARQGWAIRQRSSGRESGSRSASATTGRRRHVPAMECRPAFAGVVDVRSSASRMPTTGCRSGPKSEIAAARLQRQRVTSPPATKTALRPTRGGNVAAQRAPHPGDGFGRRADGGRLAAQPAHLGRFARRTEAHRRHWRQRSIAHLAPFQGKGGQKAIARSL